MDATRFYTDDELDTWIPVAALLELLPRELDAQLLRDADLTHFDYFALSMLTNSPDHRLQMKELASMTNATMPRLSHVVSRLERRGLVARERRTTDAILAAMQAPALDLVGKDTLKQLPALLERADLVMTPDSGPMHIANAMGTRVLGLHAASNPLRSGPYSDVRYCVDRYDAAARKFLGKPASELRWGTKIEFDDVMQLISVDDAVAAFERYVNDTHTSSR